MDDCFIEFHEMGLGPRNTTSILIEVQSLEWRFVGDKAHDWWYNTNNEVVIWLQSNVLSLGFFRVFGLTLEHLGLWYHMKLVVELLLQDWISM